MSDASPWELIWGELPAVLRIDDARKWLAGARIGRASVSDQRLRATPVVHHKPIEISFLYFLKMQSPCRNDALRLSCGQVFKIRKNNLLREYAFEA